MSIQYSFSVDAFVINLIKLTNCINRTTDRQTLLFLFRYIRFVQHEEIQSFFKNNPYTLNEQNRKRCSYFIYKLSKHCKSAMRELVLL